MVEIRTAKLSDIDQLTALFEAYRKFYRQAENPEQAKIFLADRINKGESEIILAIDKTQNILIGFTQLYPSFTSTRMRRTWILNDLFVRRDYRGKGISKKLIDAAKQHCISTNAFGLMLETEKTNIIGNKLYPSIGFTLETNNFYYWVNH